MSAPRKSSPVPARSLLGRSLRLLAVFWAFALTSGGAKAAGAGWAILESPAALGAAVDGPVNAFARSADGSVVVGSNRLSVYDGLDWQVVPTPPGAYAFRALAPAGDRVWIGGIGALGYIAANASGRWEFTSLEEPLRRTGLPPIGDVWHVHATERGAIFVTSDRVLRWDGTAFTAWSLPSRHRLHGFSVGGELWIYQTGVGVLRLGDSGPVVHLSENSLPAAPPVIAWLRVAEGEDWVVFADQIYRWSAGTWTRLDGASPALKGRLAIGAAQVDRDHFAIGTFNGGVILLNRDGQLAGIVDGRRGLADDNVTAIAADREGQAWIGLGSAEVARLSGVGIASRYQRDAGMNTGVIRKVVLHEGEPCVLTSRGLFVLADGRLEPLARAPQLLWDATSVDGRLWMAGFGGIWEVGAGGAQIAHEVSADVLLFGRSAGLRHGLLFLENYTLKSWTRGERGWVPRALVPPVEDTPLSLVEDQRGTLWLSTIGGRIYGFEWEPGEARLRPTALRPAQPRGAPVLARPRLFATGERVVAFTATSIYAFTPQGSGLEQVDTLKDFVGVTVAASEHGASGGPSYWVVRRREFEPEGPCALLRVEATASGFSWEALTAPGLDGIGPIVSAVLAPAASSSREMLWIAGADGVLTLDPARLEQAGAPPAVALRAVSTADAPHEARLAFSFPAKPVLAGDPVYRYATKLEGADAGWSAPQEEPGREFTGLAPGDYTFFARAVDRFGRAGPAASIAFHVPAPWWRSPAALIAAACVALALVAGVMRWRLHRLQLQNARLNDLVAERTRELSLSNTAKSEFIENISHEIRNPLQGVVGLVQLLDEEQLQGRPHELARSLSACARTLQRVFDDVLSFSKLEYGYASLAPGRFSLHRLLEDVRDLFLSTALRQGSTITVRVPAEGWRDGFEADEGKIKSILGNFVSNALKYAPGTPITLSASILEEQAKQAEVLIEVSDGGAGVPEEEQEVIFRKFVRGAQAKATQAVGAGIGLAACRALAKLLGGNVGVESTPGRGATFFLRLPLTRTAVAPETLPSASGLAAALIVDDQGYNQIALAGVVGKLGFATECAGNAEQALAAARRQAFTLVLLDLELPGAKGPEVAALLRALPGGPEAVILGVSAHDSHEAAERCLAAGMDAFLVKPVSREHLRAAFADVVARRNPTDRETLDLLALDLYARQVPGGLAEAKRIYLQALEQELTALREALRDGPAGDVLLAAHRVRSHATIVGAVRLASAAAGLENAVRSGRMPTGEEALAPIFTAAEVVAELLNAPSATRAAASG